MSNFVEWLEEQQSRRQRDDIRRVANLVWSDFTGGCNNNYYSGVNEWLKHFEKHHANNYEQIKGMLAVAYTQYLRDRGVLPPKPEEIEYRRDLFDDEE